MEQQKLLEELERLKQEEQEIARAKAEAQAQALAQSQATERDRDLKASPNPSTGIRVPKRLMTQKIEAVPVQTAVTEVRRESQPSREPSEDIKVEKDQTTKIEVSSEAFATGLKPKRLGKLPQPQVKLNTPTENLKFEAPKPISKFTTSGPKEDSDSSISLDADEKKKKIVVSTAKDLDWTVGDSTISKKPELAFGRPKVQTVTLKNRIANDDDWDA